MAILELCGSEISPSTPTPKNMRIVDRVTKTNRSNESKGRNALTMSVETTETIKPGDRLDELDEELLPGIPNHLTIAEISTKLSWGDLQILSSVSHSWEQALQSRLIYDERVRAQSREALAIVRHHVGSSWVLRLGLYSNRDKSWYDIPPIDSHEGIPCDCQCIAVDGKLYVLGGHGLVCKSFLCSDNCFSRDMYVLDLAGQRSWNRCASMHHRRFHFGVGMLDGKIYVFGGKCHSRAVLECEVYDPNVDAWSAIESMPEGRVSHCVTTVGEELWICGGLYIDDTDGEEYFHCGSEMLVYNPVQNSWRSFKCGKVQECFNTGLFGTASTVFIAQGKFHRLRVGAIDVYDTAKDSWSLLHSFSGFPGEDSPDCDSYGGPIIFLGGELLTKQCIWRRSKPDELHAEMYGGEICGVTEKRFLCWRLLETRGFYSGNKDIVWEITRDIEWERDEEDCVNSANMDWTSVFCPSHGGAENYLGLIHL